MGEAIAAIMGGCSAILLGRRTYEEFAPAWSAKTADEDPGAPFMNDTAKYVVSSMLHRPEWAHSTALGRYRPDAIRELKNQVDGGIYVSGSGTLVRALLATASWTTCTCSSTRWSSAAASGCSPRTGPRRGWRWPAARATPAVLHLTYQPA